MRAYSSQMSGAFIGPKYTPARQPGTISWSFVASSGTPNHTTIVRATENGRRPLPHKCGRRASVMVVGRQVRDDARLREPWHAASLRAANLTLAALSTKSRFPPEETEKRKSRERGAWTGCLRAVTPSAFPSVVGSRMRQ